MNKKEIGISNLDKQISLFVTLQVVLLGAKNILVQGVPFLFDINERLNIIILSLISVLYAIVLVKSFFRKSCLAANCFNVFIILSIISSFSLFPQNIPEIKDIALRWIVVCFFTGYLVSKLRTSEYLKKYMLAGSYVITVSALIFAYVISLIGHSTTSEWSTYSMSMSNVVLLAVMWQLHAFFKEKNKVALIAAIVGFVIIFMYGSRNPMLAIFTYIAIESFDSLRHSRSAFKQGLTVVLVILFGFFAINGRQIISVAAKSLMAMGIENRTLDLIINADTEDFSTGRDDIHKDVTTLIWKEPLLGNGICGAEANIGEMSHSFYLDIFVTYGIVIGALFLLTIAVLCLQALKKSSGLEHQVLVMYMCLVFPRGFTGGDMWQSDVFWWLMGIVFMILTTSNFKKKLRWQASQS